MAIFRLQISSIARGGRHTSVGAAAYRAGEKIRDDRTNELHNHSRRKDVTHSEILLPGHLAGENMEWALNRASLWNSVESAEARKNARVATEIQVTLPFELPPQGRLAMARTFSQEVADHYKVAVDLAVHDPRPSGDPRNFHAHLLLTTREVSGAGLGPKTGLDMPTSERVRLGLPNISQEFTAIRERWATLTNEALKQANIGARVDHRSLAEQGIDREPSPHIPFAAYKIERAGNHSEVAESIRADYNARVQERLERAAEPTPELLESARAAPKSLEDIRREARENWLRMRAEQNGKPASPSKEAQTGNAAAPPTHSTGAQSAGADGLTPVTAGRTHNSPATEDDYQP
jgi:ATP-dependent exoDNAse (exonuclease V) alpha subunit